MSKRVRNLLVIGLFILSMAIVLLVLILTQPKGEAEEDVASDTTVVLTNYGRDNIANMTITNENGSFTVRNGVQGFTIDEYAEFRLNSTTLAAAGRCVAELNAQALVEENAQDLGKYGLAEDSPKARCDVVLKDGREFSVFYGIDAPDGKTRYVRLADSNDVYTVLLNSSGYFYNREDDFISLAVTDELTNNNTAPVIDYMTVTRKDLDYDIKFEDDSKNYAEGEVSLASSQVMIAPIYAHLDISNSNAIMYGLWGLTASDVVKVHPTEEDFKEYGLDDPFCTVDLDAELVNYHLDIGNVSKYEPDENGEPTATPAEYYCYFNGIDIIYTFAASEVPWASFMPIDILTSLMTGNYIYALDYIDVEYFDDPALYHFDITGDIDEQTVAGTVDGSAFDPETFKILYQYILKCPIDDVYMDEVDENALVARIEIHRADGDGDLLEFYDIGSNRVGIKFNGTVSFSQPRNYLNVLKKNIEDFKNGAGADELQEIW